ncbi:MAG: hypothetical protein FJZ47_23515, partial [Candidatus Tectomicrobia bacterium]|nr:hypothetical protein [Candidatus Tectomicrobia bacterium]
MALFFSPDDDSSISDSSWPRVDVIRLKITPFLIALAAFLLSLVAACGTLNENENGSESESNALAAEHRQSVLSALPVTPRGKRILAMDVGPGQGETLDAALAKAKSAGITTVVLNYDWVDIEPTPLTYQHARLTTDNTYYSTAPHDASVVLNIRPIAGACRRVPPDLTNVAWDDPVMITRFHYLLYWIWSHLPHLTVHAMSIGTEVDAHFAPDGYAAYKTFFEAARMNAQRYWGAALPVGVTTTWDA